MRVDRVEFHNAMKQMAKVADRKAVLPILRHVLLRFRKGKLALKATDYDQFLSAELEAEGDDFTACLPAKLLCQLVKPEGKKNSGDVRLEPQADNKVAVELDGLSTILNGLDPADLPVGIHAENWSLLAMWPSGALRESLGYVLPAASVDETRQNLQSVFLDAGTITATDGHRLHQAPLPSALDGSLLVPATATETLRRILPDDGQVVIAQSDEHIRFGAGQWKLETRLVDATFPETGRVIPDRADQGTRLVVETKVFSKALERVSRLSTENRVKFVINGTFTIASDDYDLGQAETIVPTVENNHDGAKDLVVGYNATYLLDALKTGDETVELALSDPLGPVRIDMRGAGRLAVVMPLRI